MELEIHKIKKGNSVILPATTTDAVAHPDRIKLTDLINDYNVSVLYPGGGADGGDIYTIDTAVQRINGYLSEEYKRKGVILKFNDEQGIPQEYVFSGDNFSDVNSWSKIGIGKFNDLEYDFSVCVRLGTENPLGPLPQPGTVSADFSTQALQDDEGNVIKRTYAKKEDTDTSIENLTKLQLGLVSIFKLPYITWDSKWIGPKGDSITISANAKTLFFKVNSGDTIWLHLSGITGSQTQIYYHYAFYNSLEPGNNSLMIDDSYVRLFGKDFEGDVIIPNGAKLLGISINQDTYNEVSIKKSIYEVINVNSTSLSNNTYLTSRSLMNSPSLYCIENYESNNVKSILKDLQRHSNYIINNISYPTLKYRIEGDTIINNFPILISKDSSNIFSLQESLELSDLHVTVEGVSGFMKKSNINASGIVIYDESNNLIDTGQNNLTAKDTGYISFNIDNSLFKIPDLELIAQVGNNNINLLSLNKSLGFIDNNNTLQEDVRYSHTEKIKVNSGDTININTTLLIPSGFIIERDDNKTEEVIISSDNMIFPTLQEFPKDSIFLIFINEKIDNYYSILNSLKYNKYLFINTPWNNIHEEKIKEIKSIINNRYFLDLKKYYNSPQFKIDSIKLNTENDSTLLSIKIMNFLIDSGLIINN